MVFWLMGLLLLAALLALAAAGLTAFGARRWAASTHTLLARLEAGRLPSGPANPGRYDPRDIETLPAPVQRFFRNALTPG